MQTAGRRNLIWGHSGLIRRPKDSAWDKRTDTFHRTAASVLEDYQCLDPEPTLLILITRHCASYGPVHRKDLAFFFGVGLTKIDAAITALGDLVVRHIGPGGEDLVDLAGPPRGGDSDPGCRLLGEFDGLLLGFHGHHRTRFCDDDQLAAIWSKANGLFAPVVLRDQRLVATWRTVSRRGLSEIEITMLPGQRRLPADVFADAADAVGTALNLEIAELRVLDP